MSDKINEMDEFIVDDITDNATQNSTYENKCAILLEKAAISEYIHNRFSLNSTARQMADDILDYVSEHFVLLDEQEARITAISTMLKSIGIKENDIRKALNEAYSRMTIR